MRELAHAGFRRFQALDLPLDLFRLARIPHPASRFSLLASRIPHPASRISLLASPFPGSEEDERMPPHRQDPEGGDTEQPHQGGTRCPDGRVHDSGEVAGQQADQGVRRGEVFRADARGGPDAVGNEQYEATAQGRGARRRQAAQPLERGERPADPEHRQQHRARAQEPPQAEPQPRAPAPRQRRAHERQTEEDPDDERPDSDQLAAHFRLHVMRRSAYWGTTPNRSCLAAKAMSSPRFASTSWRAAVVPSNASAQPSYAAVSARAAAAASFSSSFLSPVFTALTSRPAV